MQFTRSILLVFLTSFGASAPLPKLNPPANSLEQRDNQMSAICAALRMDIAQGSERMAEIMSASPTGGAKDAANSFMSQYNNHAGQVITGCVGFNSATEQISQDFGSIDQPPKQ